MSKSFSPFAVARKRNDRVPRLRLAREAGQTRGEIRHRDPQPSQHRRRQEEEAVERSEGHGRAGVARRPLRRGLGYYSVL